MSLATDFIISNKVKAQVTGKSSNTQSLASQFISKSGYGQTTTQPVVKPKTTAPSVKGGLSSLFNPVTNPVSTPIAKTNPFQSPLQEVIKKQIADNKSKKTEVPFKIDTSNIKEQESIIKESPVSITSAKATPKAKEKLREYVTDEGSIQPTVDKITANPTVKKVLTGIARRTSGTGIVATLKSASPEVTFAQAYEVARKAQAEKNDTLIEQFITGLGDTMPQTAIGVALGFVPYVGIPLSIAYFSAISAGSELEEKGKVTLTNVAIDVVLDRVLGKTLESLLKSPAKTLFRTVKKAFVTEGGTEVAQDLLKYGNNYRLASTDEEKEAILKEAQEYFTSGQILVTAGVGGVSGGGIAIVGSVLTPQQAINETLGTPKQDTPESKKIISVAVEAQQIGANVKITEDGAEITNEEPKVAPIIEPEPKVETQPAEGLTPEVKVETPKVTPPKKEVEVKTPKPIIPKEPDKFTSRVFERLQQERPEVLTGNLEVERRNLNTEAKKAVDLIAKDKQKAYDIAMNKEESSEVSSTTANIALAEKALEEGNTELYRKLIVSRSLDLTRKGFDIAAEKASINDNSTAKYVKELISTRLESLGKRYLSGLTDGSVSNKEHSTKVMDKKVAKLETEIRNKKLNVKTALQLLESLTCLT